MQAEATRAAEAAARVLALMVAANGRIDERELRALDGLDAFRRLGVDRGRFLALAHECVADIGSHLCEKSWLRIADRLYVDRLLHAVPHPTQRLVVCRLAAAAITADGRVTRDERLVYDYTLVSWRISQTMVSHAIMRDPVH